MPTEIRYSRGTSQYPEDLPIFFPAGSKEGLFGVADGVSGLWFGQPPLFGGKTGGQIASSALVAACAAERSAEAAIPKANRRLRTNARKTGLNLLWSETLPAAAFTLADIKDQTLWQAGDCMAVWETVRGSVSFTPNPMLAYERWVLGLRDELVAKDGDRKRAMQKFFGETLVQTRRQCVNTSDALGYAVLNGQPQFLEHVRRYLLPSIENLRRILLFTDGLVTVEDTARPDFGEWILDLYDHGGFEAILARTREEKSLVAAKSHELHAETTLVVWEPEV